MPLDLLVRDPQSIAWVTVPVRARVTVHRSTRKIGGNCIEVAEDGGGRIVVAQ